MTVRRPWFWGSNHVTVTRPPSNQTEPIWSGTWSVSWDATRFTIGCRALSRWCWPWWGWDPWWEHSPHEPRWASGGCAGPCSFPFSLPVIFLVQCSFTVASQHPPTAFMAPLTKPTKPARHLHFGVQLLGYMRRNHQERLDFPCDVV